MSFPFRFYGRDARDWAEGANLGHTFDVVFARAPAEEERARLGAAWDEATATGILRPGPWRWSGRYAELVAGERWTSHGGHLGAVADFLREAHAIVPIVDVTYHLARESGGPWDRWSVAQGAPEPGPDTGSRALVPEFRRPIDASLPAPEPDRAFDDAVARSRRARDERRIADALSVEPAPGKVGLARVERALERPPRTSAFVAPDPEFVEAGTADDPHLRPADGDHPLDGTPRPLALFVPPGSSYYDGIAWIDREGARHELEIPGGNVGGVSMSPSGDEVLLVQSGAAWHVDLRRGEPRLVLRKEPADGYELRGTAFADGGRWAVLSSKRLQLLEPAALPRVIATVAIADAGSLRAARAGRVLVVRRGKKVDVFGVAGDVVAKLGAFDAPLSFDLETDGAVYLTTGTGGPDEPRYELTHLDAALAALSGRAAKKAKKAAPSRGAKKKLDLRLSDEAIEHAPSREVPEVAARFGAARVVVGASGRAAAVPIVEAGGVRHERGLRYLGDDGTIRDVSAALEALASGSAVGAVAVSPSGRRIVAVGISTKAAAVVAGVDAASGAVAKIVEYPFELGNRVRAAHLVSDDDLLVLAEKVLRRLRRAADGTWSEVASAKVTKAFAFAPRELEGALLVPVLGDSPKALALFSGAEGGLRPLGGIAARIRALDWRGDELLAWETQGRWRRVEGLG